MNKVFFCSSKNAESDSDEIVEPRTSAVLGLCSF